MSKQVICICGGGNLAHVLAGFLAAQSNCEVHLLTRHPECWQEKIQVIDVYGKVFSERIKIITSNPQEALIGANIVLLCLPGFAIAEELGKIKDFILPEQFVGSVVSSTGFFLMAKQILPKGTSLFGFQRVPFIARINEYGKSASLLGYKSSLSFATDSVDEPMSLASTFSSLFGIPVYWLDNFLKVTLTNSNPLLHPSRLYSLFNTNIKEFDNPLLFYGEWDNRSSETYIVCDDELQLLLRKLSISEEDIPPVLSYYECSDAISLTQKMRSIKAFQGIMAPMKKTKKGKYVADYQNRYFTEDIPFGLLLIKAFAEKMSVPTPIIDEIIGWAQGVMDKEYIVNHQLKGKNIKETIAKYIL